MGECNYYKIVIGSFCQVLGAGCRLERRTWNPEHFYLSPERNLIFRFRPANLALFTADFLKNTTIKPGVSKLPFLHSHLHKVGGCFIQSIIK
jgi:hypothetical protein